MTPLDFAASEQVIVFIPSKNLSVGQQGNLAIPSPPSSVSQGLKGSNSTQASDSPWDEAFQQARVSLGWIHLSCQGAWCLLTVRLARMGWGTAGSQHTPVSPHRTQQ